MPKIDSSKTPTHLRKGYPGKHKKITAGYEGMKVGDEVGLTQFGVNRVVLKPGGASALRHWHENEDEFVIVHKGEVVLVEDSGESVLRAGDCAGFKAGLPNGHHIINKSDEDAVLFEIGTRLSNEKEHYTQVDMLFHKNDGVFSFTKRDGSPIED